MPLQFYGLLLIAVPLPFEIFTLIARNSDVQRKHIVLLTLCFVSFNLVWYFTILFPKSELVLELLLYGVSIVVISFSYYFWSEQIGIKIGKRGIQVLIINLLLIFYAISFGNLLGIEQKSTFNYVVIAYSQIVVLYFAGKVIKQIIARNSPANRIKKAVLISSCIACVTPIMLFTIENFIFRYLIINSGFFLVTTAYIQEFVIQMKIEYDEREQHLLLQKRFELQSEELESLRREQSHLLENFQSTIPSQEVTLTIDSKIDEVLAYYPDLTERQYQIAKLIAKGYSYSSISEQLFISKDTVRKHAQDTSQKMGMKGYKKLRYFILNHDIKNKT